MPKSQVPANQRHHASASSHFFLPSLSPFAVAFKSSQLLCDPSRRVAQDLTGKKDAHAFGIGLQVLASSRETGDVPMSDPDRVVRSKLEADCITFWLGKSKQDPIFRVKFQLSDTHLPSRPIQTATARFFALTSWIKTSLNVLLAITQVNVQGK